MSASSLPNLRGLLGSAGRRAAGRHSRRQAKQPAAASSQAAGERLSKAAREPSSKQGSKQASMQAEQPEGGERPDAWAGSEGLPGASGRRRAPGGRSGGRGRARAPQPEGRAPPVWSREGPAEVKPLPLPPPPPPPPHKAHVPLTSVARGAIRATFRNCAESSCAIPLPMLPLISLRRFEMLVKMCGLRRTVDDFLHLSNNQSTCLPVACTNSTPFGTSALS